MTSERNQRDRWTAGYLLIVLTAGAYLPTPLYPGYRHEFGFGDLTMTLIYATFAVVATPTLLVTGRLMDAVSPRHMLRVGVVLAGLGSVGFALAQQPAWLFAARAAHGLALGISTGAAATILADREPRSTRLSGPLLACMTFVSGTAVGPLVSGTLAQYGTVTQAPYLLHLGLLAFGWYRLRGLSRNRGVNPSEHHTDDEHLPHRNLRRPRRLGAVVVLACLTGFLAWTAAGLFLALIPAVLSQTLGTANTALSGGVVGLVLIWSVLAQPLVARIGSTGAVLVGTASLVAALVTLTTTGQASPLVLATTTVLVGVGHGLGYGAAVVSVEARAPRSRRASLTAVLYVSCYLGSALPAVVVGALSRWHTLADAVALLAAVTVPIALVAFVASGWALLAGRFTPRFAHSAPLADRWRRRPRTDTVPRPPRAVASRQDPVAALRT